MANQQLLNYIKSQLEDGVSKEEIRNILLQNGWADADVDEALLAVAPPTPESVVPNAGVPSPQIPSLSVSTSPSQVAGTMPQTELAGIGTLMSRAMSTYFSRFWVLIGINIISSAAVFLYIGATNLLDISVFIKTNIIFTYLPILFFVVISLWSQVSTLYAIKDSTERIGIMESYRRGWRSLLSYWWIMIIIMAVVMGGSILFIIPAVLFAVWFSFASYVLVTENLKGMDALMKSKEYVRGKWWGVFGRVLALWVPILVFVAVVGITLSSMGFKQDSTVHYLVMQVINLFIWPFALAYSFSIYQSLKETRGTFVFESKGKGKFIAVGILGVLVISIGILSPIILTSLNVAKERAQDAMGKAGTVNFSNSLKTEGGQTTVIVPTTTTREQDALRRNAIAEILVAAESYYSANNGLYPSSLEQLVPQYLERKTILDPGSNIPYKYTNKGGGSYELCAKIIDYKTSQLKDSCAYLSP